MTITFDDSIPALVGALQRAGIDSSEGGGVIVRDIRGRLSFVARDNLPGDLLEKVDLEINEDLRPYISPIGAAADKTSPGATRVLSDGQALRLTIDRPDGENSIRIMLLDRRAVGVDWLHAPLANIEKPPRLVFASLKGGLGRSTAISVLAAELADRGRSVLVVDLDLEAPGMGTMLIEQDATPRYGSIDYFVESGIRELEDEFLMDCMAPSWLGGGRGRVDVVPALGSRSLDNPADVLSKLARAYVEHPNDEAEPGTFLVQVQEFVKRVTGLRRYDAVLVDARAGLHETTAAAILGLSADVLLFGVDQPQTHVGFTLLLSHLARLPVTDLEHDWRYRLRVIQAKAIPSQDALVAYRTHCYDDFERVFYGPYAASSAEVLEEGFRFSVDDPDAPHYAIPIFEDDRYRLFDPVRDRTQLTQEFYQKSFGEFIQFCAERLELVEDD